MRRFFFSSDFCRLIAQKAAVIVFLVTVCYNETNRDLRRFGMKRELGIARCGLACCLCSENDHCSGCSSNDCPDKDWCENRKCSIEKQYAHCYDCKSTCRKGLLSKIKPYGFTVFVKRYGETELLDCLARNEKAGVIYHRGGVSGDYDAFDDVEQLIRFIKTGKR